MDRAAPKLLTCIVMLCITVDAAASGFRPLARADSITVFRGGEASVLDSGADSVLDNDFDIERDPLTAVLYSEPKRGSLELNPDGTFVYRHDGSDKDEDEFRYRAFDGTRYSRRVTVSIRIEDVPNTPPRVVGEVDDQEAAEDAYFELALADNFTDPDPDDFLTFSASGLPNSGSLTIDPVSGVLSGTPVRGDARSKPYDVTIRARDKFSASASLSFEMRIIEDQRADISLDVRVVTNPVGVGETSRWELVVVNNGPSALEMGVLNANWATAGPALSLSAPGGCTLSENNTRTPGLSCNVSALAAGATATYPVEGVQADAGDNTLIGVVIADDPRLGNNSDLASAQVVAAFSEGPTQVIDFAGTGIDAGDLNADGEIDIVATGGDTAVFFNNGNRALVTPGASLGAGGASAVTLLDWNGDGHLDIAASGLGDGNTEVFVNDGAGAFTSAERLQGNVGSVRAIADVDLDSNGQSELVIAGSSGIVIARNGAATLLLSNTGGIDVATADIDLDGAQDIVAVRATDRTVDLYFNDGSGGAFNQAELQSGSVGTVSIADLNADGAPDLLFGRDGDDLQAPQHQVYYQQGNGQFTAGQSFGASPVTGLLAGDINDDGWNDVATINQAGVHQVYLGSSTGDLVLAPEQLVSAGMTRGVLVDFNGDESLDLLLAGVDAGALEIHANNGIGRLGRGDRTAPDLQLLGEATITLAAGQTYVEPGATAIDDIDGDVTDFIEISGTVNTTAVGTQTLTYRVSDRAGNTSTAVRTIKVGVNEGTGGSGGGAISPLLLLLFGLLALLRQAGRRPQIF
jgi:hypothetical protein